MAAGARLDSTLTVSCNNNLPLISELSMARRLSYAIPISRYLGHFQGTFSYIGVQGNGLVPNLSRCGLSVACTAGCGYRGVYRPYGR